MKFSVLCLVVFWFCLAQAQPQTPVSQSLVPGGPDKWELVWSDEFDGPDAELEGKWKSPVWLSLAVIPWAGRITDAIDGTAMEVDYVRIYRKKP